MTYSQADLRYYSDIIQYHFDKRLGVFSLPCVTLRMIYLHCRHLKRLDNPLALNKALSNQSFLHLMDEEYDVPLLDISVQKYVVYRSRIEATPVYVPYYASSEIDPVATTLGLQNRYVNFT